MKKISCFLLLAFAFSVFGNQELTLYDYEGYVSKDIITQFEQENNIKVKVKTFSDMSVADSLVVDAKEEFDLIVGTNYILESWIANNKIQPLNLSLLPNYSNLNKVFLYKLNAIDKGNKYAVPYISNVAKIAVKSSNAKKIFKEDLPNTWGLLFHEQYLTKLAECGVALGMSPLQTYSAFMLYKARDLSLNAKTITTVTNELIKLKTYYKYADSNILIKEGLSSNKICIAFGWSSFSSDKDLTLLDPVEGMPMYIDSWVIPSHSKNIEAAHKFINFTLRSEVAVKIVKHTSGITAVNGVKNLIDEDFAQNHNIFIENKELQKMYLFKNLNNEQKELLQQEWKRFNQF